MAQEDQIIGKVLQETYCIERLIGEGGMGAVYEASHLRLRRRFAIKLLFPQVAESSEAVARFRREGEVTSELGHPNIIEIIDLNFTPEGTAYIVMELLTGESLSSRIQGGRLELEEVSSILRQAASALAAAHSHGVIHRDLKPQNIFIARREDGSEVVKVLDFGISKVLGSSSMMTGTSALLGTPNYMAPEQAEGHAAEADVRTDVFALGAILYEMLAGRPAFVGQSVPSILYQVVHQEPPALRELRPDLSEEGVRVVSKAMSKKAGARYGSIDALAQDFATATNAAMAIIPPTNPAVIPPTIAAPQAPQAGPAPAAPLFPKTTLSGSVGELHTEVPPGRSPALIMGLVVAAAVLAGSGVYLGTRPDDPAPKPKVALGPGAPEVTAADMAIKPDVAPAAVARALSAKGAGTTGKVKAAAGVSRPKAKKPPVRRTASAPKRPQPRRPGNGPDSKKGAVSTVERGTNDLRRRRERVKQPRLPKITKKPIERPAGEGVERPLRPARAGGYGELRIVAQVSGKSYRATVYVDGKKIAGKAPVRIYRIAAGEHTVQIELRNFKSTPKTVWVRPNSTTTTIVKLTPTGQ